MSYIITSTNNIQTPRLILRQWQDSDTAPFIQMCADDDVMRYFLKKLNAEEAIAFMNRLKSTIATRGWGLFAVELKATGEFIGFIGLHQHLEHYDFAPCIEIGWRLESNTGTTVMPPKVQKQSWIMLFVSCNWRT